ncbi:MAG: hypothetical protein IJS27_01570 [Ruminococcus sp.]|nr:hypothetical protein [Ruminococcus sp.]
MKKTLLFLIIITAALMLFSIHAQAETLEPFDESVDNLVDNVSDEVRERMEQLGYGDADITQISDLSVSNSLSVIRDMIGESIAGPLSSAALLTAVIILSSLLESYTFSLRYVDTKDVMNVVSSLLVITVLVTPITSLIQSALNTVTTASNLMLAYVPIMAGIMALSGHVVSSGGYYATVMAACQGIAQLTSRFLAPLLNIFLALTVTSAIGERVKLGGICELLSKLMKWTLTFSMTVFTAVLSLQSFAAGSVDSVASKAMRFTMSSFIPVVGASLSEAYKTLEGSVNLLRSGVGVFVIIAVIVAFLPLIVRVLLWQLSVMIAKTVAETFGVDSVAGTLRAVSSVLSVLFALIACLTAVFIISTGSLMAIGGGS